MSRLHGVFGNETRPAYTSAEREEKRPHDPKHLVYEVFGPPGTLATISYFDAEAEPQLVKKAPLPWSMEFPITDLRRSARARCWVVSRRPPDRPHWPPRGP
ncbi:hypothetical protein JOF57_002440 [Mycolicibacterium lutetiense]|uniref:Homogentisate 1,2-dioxygenase n=1 Tax=Mycolicibacterium lutetiense TaxID=1641992 RepID=A0ABS4ZSN3_9MYCO|nr:hypothetical protein [Mycolicibacterium lutetiense]